MLQVLISIDMALLLSGNMSAGIVNLGYFCLTLAYFNFLLVSTARDQIQAISVACISGLGKEGAWIVSCLSELSRSDSFPYTVCSVTIAVGLTLSVMN